MSYVEHALSFACGDDTLVGVVAVPAAPLDVGVLIVVGGPQYRAGSHRQFVLLARALAAAGIAALRFDCRGMGDSTGVQQSFEQSTADIAAALDAFERACPATQRFVLWGLCDAAAAALLFLDERADPRVVGVAVLNPWVRSDGTMARVQLKHYYGRRLAEPALWAKLLRGRLDLRAAARGLVGSIATAVRPRAASSPARSFQARMATAWRRFDGRILLLMSGRDLTAREFETYAATDAAWAGLIAEPKVQRVDLADADHTFSSVEWRAEVERRTIDWIRALGGSSA